MKYKKIMILAIFLVSLFAISAVSAQDNATSDVVSVDETIDDVISVDEADEVVSVEDNYQVIEQTEKEETISATDNGTFTALQKKIDNAVDGSTITLENDYAYDDSVDKSIIIDKKSLIIDGKNHKISALNTEGMLDIVTQYDGKTEIVLKNINFVNCYCDYYNFYGTSEDIRFENCNFTNCPNAICFIGHNLSVINSNFINCNSPYNPGAINFIGNNLSVISSNFINCSSKEGYGGAISLKGYNHYIINSNFIQNTVYQGSVDSDSIFPPCYGGAIFCNSENFSITGCSFSLNSANSVLEKGIGNGYGGAIYIDSEKSNGHILNSTFDYNYASAKGGAIYNSGNLKLSNSKFDLGKQDAIYNSDSSQCQINNCVFADDLYPILTAKGVTKTYGTSTQLVVYLKDSEGKAISNAKVNVNINNKITPITTNSNGQATMAISQTPGTYYAKISYPGAKEITAKIVVKKATPKLTAKAKTFKKSVKTKKYTITLKTNTNKVMKNTKVTLKVNGITYKATTNYKGQATFKITKLAKKGKFTAVVKYAGSKYYNAKTVKSKITVK